MLRLWRSSAKLKKPRKLLRQKCQHVLELLFYMEPREGLNVDFLHGYGAFCAESIFSHSVVAPRILIQQQPIA